MPDRDGAAARKRRARAKERAGLVHMAAWVRHRDLEALYDLAEKMDGDLAAALAALVRRARSLPPPVTRDIGSRSVLG